jgi:hypothetical protein
MATDTVALVAVASAMVAFTVVVVFMAIALITLALTTGAGKVVDNSHHEPVYQGSAGYTPANSSC